jgi:hypothetical protein
VFPVGGLLSLFGLGRVIGPSQHVNVVIAVERRGWFVLLLSLLRLLGLLGGVRGGGSGWVSEDRTNLDSGQRRREFVLSFPLVNIGPSFGRRVDGVHGQRVNRLPSVVGLYPLPRRLLLFFVLLVVVVLVFVLAKLKQVEDRGPAELLAETGTAGATGAAGARLVGRGHSDGANGLTSVSSHSVRGSFALFWRKRLRCFCLLGLMVTVAK